MTKPADDLASDPLLATAPILEGFKVLDPAVLYAKVGGGGMGAVYCGRHFSLECDLAVKVLKRDLATDEQFVLRFEREARLAARIKNDNVVQVLDVRQKNGIHYLVMEFVKGETARERVQRKGKLAEGEALAILLGATRGLRAAHEQGIVHRDIKPDNVLIGVYGAVKLADLGIAKQAGAGENLTMIGSGPMGTPEYMPPEQWNSPDVKPAADVWALGATLWYLLAGKSAIRGRALVEIADQTRNHDFPDLASERPDVRPEVCALIAKCTRREASERFADARELLLALKPLCRDLDDEVLHDAKTGTGKSSIPMVTPPPRGTLAKIRLAVLQGVEARATEIAGPPLPRSEQPTLPQAHADAVRASGDDAGKAQAALARGRELLPLRGEIDNAIAAFAEALRLDAQLDEAKQSLALASVRKAKDLERSDPDGALELVSRALRLAPNVSGGAAARARVEKLLRERLVAGLSLDEPSADAALPTRQIAVRGTLTSPKLKALRIALAPGASQPDTPFPRTNSTELPVVAGDWEGALTASTDGKQFLRVEVEDQLGLLAELPWRPVFVDTAPPVLVWSEPTTETVSAGDVTVRGTVTDALSVEVLVNGAAANVEGNRWWAAVRVAAGQSREVKVTAKDAAGHDSEALMKTLRGEDRIARLDWGDAAKDAKLVEADGKKYPSIVVEKQTGMRMVLIPSGKFTMGSPASEAGRFMDEKQHPRVIRKAFYLGEAAVTQAQWQRVMGDNPSKFQAAENPVEVSWNKCQEFVQKLNGADSGFRLPSEAEWEYACRAGTTTAFSFGANIAPAQVNYRGDRPYNNAAEGHYREKTVPVRSLPANAFGLYEMHGNVYEWCEDTYAEYPGTGTEEPTLDEEGENLDEEDLLLVGERVIRGGSWAFGASCCRSASRGGCAPSYSGAGAGFRLARALQ